MPEIFVAREAENDILDNQAPDQSAGTAAKGSVVDDILGLDEREAEDFADLLADRIASTTISTTGSDTGSTAGTTEVSMAGGEIGFQDGDPKDAQGKDDESDIVKKLKEQGFIKEAPGKDDGPPDFGEVDPGTLEENRLEAGNSALLQDWNSILADREVTIVGSDSYELWI